MGATTTIQTVSLAKGEATYESDMPMKHLNRIMRAAREDNLDELIEGLAAFTISWPYNSAAGEPGDPEAWGELKRTQFNELTKAILADLGALGNE
jgi:hypothetical protein